MSIKQTFDRYVVSRYSTIPTSYQITIKDQRCYLPVSLGTKPFQRPMLDAVVEWIADHFSHCAVLVGDSVHRLTLQITENLSPMEAKAKAIWLGDVFIADTLALFEDRMTGRFDFFKCSTIEREQVECAAYQTTLMRIFENDEGFRSSINGSAADYVERRFKNSDPASISTTRPQMMNLSRQYLIEEMALFATMVQMGWTVDVYPGEELITFVEIAEGKYSNVPAPLRRRKSVELKLKGTLKPERTAAAAASAFTSFPSALPTN